MITIGKQLFESLSILEDHLEKGLFFVIKATLISLDIQMLIGQEMQVIGGLHRVIMFLLGGFDLMEKQKENGCCSIKYIS